MRDNVSTIKRVGFVIDGLVPLMTNCLKKRTIRPLFQGWNSNSSVNETRYRTIADWVAKQNCSLSYEVYKPWRRYDVVVFLKSMDRISLKLAERLTRSGCKTVFDLNVDYLTPASGIEYFQGMAPTEAQRKDALAMIEMCNAVIADSQWLQQVATKYADKVFWIPDCVEDDFIRERKVWKPEKRGPLPLLWSGEAVKLFDLLQIESVLYSLRDTIRLVLITNSLDALDRIHQPWRERLHRLLTALNCEILPFSGLPGLMEVYAKGGVFISPRFLDNSYNMGHTEWKITLAMAQGRMALCSPQPSYKDVAKRSNGKGIRLCHNDDDWLAAFEEIMAEDFDWSTEEEGACKVVRTHYSTSVVALAHTDCIKKLLKD